MLSRRVMFIAGEDSGDQHAARVIVELKRLVPDVKLFGYGGFRMEAAGMQLIENLAQKLPIIGITQVLLNFRSIRRLLTDAARLLEQQRPDVLVLVDYPGFNLRTAAAAKRLGIPVIYYISPQVWVWHKSRLKVIAETVSRMLVILPFEEDFYRKSGLEARYVGHPLQDDQAPLTPLEEVRSKLGAEHDDLLIGLLPGSRLSEITRHLEMLLESAQLIQAALPEARFVVPRAATIAPEHIQPILQRYPTVPVTMVDEDLKSVRAAMDFAICKSGTSTLELALLGVPMLIFYKVSALNYAIARRIVTIPHIGLVNIVAGRLIVPELIQHAATAESIAREALAILNDPRKIGQMRRDLEEVQQKVGGAGASAKVAQEIASVMVHN